jgi:3-methyladenine DNA glycosylase AlkD
MNAKDVLAELEACGSAQTRKTYARHGIGPRMFGVSYANLYRLQKKLKTDHEIAIALWASGIHDARILATMIADPARLDSQTIDAWLKDADNSVQADALAGLVGRGSLWPRKYKKWIASKEEHVSLAGWHLLARAALHDETLDDDFFAAWLPRLERTIHTEPNRTRYSMNNALIVIGVRSPQLTRLALASAKRIGKVEVDHGETSCQTPDAAAYIKKTMARKAKKRPAKAKAG